MRFCLKQNLEGNLKIALAGKVLCLPLFAPLIKTKLLYNKKNYDKYKYNYNNASRGIPAK